MSGIFIFFGGNTYSCIDVTSMEREYDFMQKRVEMGTDNMNKKIIKTASVIAVGAGLGIWGGINLMEGYGNDNPGANAHVR